MLRPRYFSNSTSIKKTSLNQWHKDRGARMIEYSGWEMPVVFKEGIISSHLHTRKQSSLFDVSHMVQLKITGTKRFDFLESLLVSDLKSLPENRGCLSLLVSESGTIIDDTIVTPKKNYIYMVCNASNAKKDLQHLKYNATKFNDVQIENLSESRSLVALQGPCSAQILRNEIYIDLNQIKFMDSFETVLFGKNVYITRCGYTGEDGFEISMKHEDAVHIVENLVGNEKIVKPAGLGARDTLRLEAGLCLYGNDIDITTTPVEANLVWTIGKKRRDIKTPNKFLGYHKVMDQLENKTWKEKRVGIITDTNRPPPQGSKIMKDGMEVGRVTSGNVSPILKKGIGMAYIKKPYHLLKTEGLYIPVRNKNLDISITKMPFVPTNYFT